MPYHDSTTLPDDPTVKIFLQGQLILEPQDDFTCDIGVNRCSPKHELSIEVRQRMIDPGSPDITLMRQLGKLEPSGVEIDLEPASTAGVKRFIAPTSFARDANTNADGCDFRWLVDLKSPEFHDAEVVVNGSDTEPNIKIRDGIFYTALRTDPDVVTVTRTGGDKADLDLNRVAALVGVNIYLSDDTVKFKLAFTQNGEKQTLVLAKPTAASGIKCYEIRINNDPPFVDPNLDLATHQELKEYYKVIDGVFVDDEPTDFKRFELLFGRPQARSAPPSGLGTPTIPCMPVGGGH
jgi:hypothetical protein